MTLDEIQNEIEYNGAYTKGVELYKCGSCFNMIVRGSNARGQQLKEASMLVRGNKSYSVTITVDEMDDLYNYECECQAFFEYGGMCKHCVAAALYYIHTRNVKQGIGDEIPMNANAYAQLELPGMESLDRTAVMGVAVRPVRTTSPVMSQLMNQFAWHKEEAMYYSESQKVHLKPIVHVSYDQVTVEFRIGQSKWYVMKNVPEFARDVKNQLYKAYGRGLSFTHTQAAFAEDSQALLHFICNIAADFDQIGRINRYSFYGSFDYNRNIPLAGRHLDEFFQTMGNKGFDVELEYADVIEYRMTRDAYEEQLIIQGVGDGIELKLPNITLLKGRDFYYIPVGDAQAKRGEIYQIPMQDWKERSAINDASSRLRGAEGFIATTDLNLFCRDLLPVLRKRYQVSLENFDPEAYQAEDISFSIYLDAPGKDMISCRVMATYDEAVYNILTNVDQDRRDLAMEGRMEQLVSGYFNTLDQKSHNYVLSKDDGLLYSLLTIGVPTFQDYAEVFISDALKKIRVLSSQGTSIGVSVSQGMLELKLTTGELSNAQLAEILSAYDRKKKYFRLKNGEFVDLSGAEMEEMSGVVEALDIKANQLKLGQFQVPAYRAYLLERELEMESVVDKEPSFKQFMEELHQEEKVEVPEGIHGELREYQKKGFLWMRSLMKNHFGGILADDMGLGKTLQVITLLLSLKKEGREGTSLIVCPASLVYNWKNEVEQFAPKLRVAMLTGQLQERKNLLEQLMESGDTDIIVTSYDLLKRDIEQYEAHTFLCQIIDEAQYIKNHTTLTAKAVKLIQAQFRMALTGTPMENRLSELWSIYDYLMPGFLFGYEHFRKSFEVPIVENQDERLLAMLRRLVSPFMLRRLKSDVLKELPDKVEEVVYAGLGDEQRKLYAAHVQRLKMFLEKQSPEEFKGAKLEVLAELTKLRQLCADPSLLYENYEQESAKTDTCMELLMGAVQSGHKVLLFSQFTSMLSILEERLKKEGVSYYMLTGSTSKSKRMEMVMEFQKDRVPVFLISLKAGGTGLNLTAADVVIHYDPWWNQAAQNQATDRAHRIGQKRSVSVYKLIVKDTIEEKILHLQEKKAQLADSILGGGELESTALNREELLELLSDRELL